MKIKIACFSVFIVIALMGCVNRYEYWELSDFRMDKDALKNGEQVKIVYTSQGPDYNRNLEYYIHLIVVSAETGDTVNVLTTIDNGFTMDDKEKLFTFLNEDNPISKLSRSNDVSDLNNPPIQNITKVARDPAFDFLANNTHPTVIGLLGTTEENGKTRIRLPEN